MLFVIAGHVLERPQFNSALGCMTMWNWIYIFHMPLFVFISGYFSQKKDAKQFLIGCWRLAEPLIVCQLIIRGYTLIQCGEITVRDVLTPWKVLWYLLSLLYWRLMLQLIPDKVLQNTRLIIASSFVISILVGFLPFDRFLSLQRTFAFLPFFCMGYCMRGRNIFIDSKYRLLSMFFLMVTMIIPIFFSKYLGNLFRADPYGSIFGACSRMLLFFLCIPMSIAVINICPHNQWMANQGKYTMQYYIYHAFMIPILMKFLSIVCNFDIFESFFGAVLCVIFIMVSISVLLKIPLFCKLTNPSTVLDRF